MDLWESDRSRHRRERRNYAGYSPFGFYGKYDEYDREIERYDRISLTRRKRRGFNCYAWCPLCTGDYREPYELLRRYDPLDDLMGEVHDCWIAMETGQIIAQDAADRIEEASRMINRLCGYDPSYKQISGFLKQLARDIQLLPDTHRVPYHQRRRRARLPWP